MTLTSLVLTFQVQEKCQKCGETGLSYQDIQTRSAVRSLLTLGCHLLFADLHSVAKSGRRSDDLLHLHPRSCLEPRSFLRDAVRSSDLRLAVRRQDEAQQLSSLHSFFLSCRSAPCTSKIPVSLRRHVPSSHRSSLRPSQTSHALRRPRRLGTSTAHDILGRLGRGSSGRKSLLAAGRPGCRAETADVFPL